MPDVEIGGVTVLATSVTIGGVPRTVNLAANALAPEPLVTTAFVSGHMQVQVSGLLVGAGETAAARRASVETMGAGLAAAVGSSTGYFTWAGTSYRMFPGDGGSVTFQTEQFGAGVIGVDATLNCLPSATFDTPES